MKLAPALSAPRRRPVSGAGSAGRIRLRKNAEPRNESASAAERQRRGQGLHQQPAHAGTGHRGHRPALVDQRVPLHVPGAGHQGHEQPGVRHGEEDAERSGRERHREQLGQAQDTQRRADRDAGQQGRPAQVGRDHGGPAVPAPVHPGPRVQGEQQAGQPDEGAEVAHLGRGGVQRQHRGERQRDRGDLVADQRDALGTPVPAESGLAQQRGDPGGQASRRDGDAHCPAPSPGRRPNGRSSGKARCR